MEKNEVTLNQEQKLSLLNLAIFEVLHRMFSEQREEVIQRAMFLLQNDEATTQRFLTQVLSK